MKLYLLIRKNKVGYDENVSMIVRAFNSSEARKLANEQCADEGKIWTDREKVSCHTVSASGRAKIIHRSFKAG